MEQNPKFPLNESPDRELTFQDYVRIIYKGKWIIFTTFVIVILITLYITLTTPPTYQATTLIMLAGKTGQTTDLFQSPWAAGNVLKVNNEIEVLKSKTLANHVLHTLESSPYADNLYILGTRRLEISNLTRIRQNAISQLKRFIKGHLGNSAAHSNGHAFQLQTPDLGRIEAVRGCMSVETIRETEAIKVTVSSMDAHEAALIANTIAQEYYNLDLEYNMTEVVEMTKFVEGQLQKIENDLVKSEERLREYQEEENIFGLDETAQILIDQLSTFEATYNTTLAEIKIVREKVKNQEEELNRRESTVITELTNTSNPLITELRKRIAEAEASKIATMLKEGLSEDDLAFREVDSRITELRNRLIAESRNLTSFGLNPQEQSAISSNLLQQVLSAKIELMALEEKSKEYKKLVDKYAAELEKLPKRSLEYARLDRERQVNEKFYMLLNTKYQESKITEASKISAVRILDPAYPPKTPVKPKKKMNMLLGALLGLGLGFTLSFLREYLDSSIKIMDDLKRVGLTTIAIVPEIDVKRALRKVQHKHQDYDLGHSLRERLISLYDPKSSVAEAYRTLRTNIQFMNPDNPVQALIISSPGPGDGKSTTVVNLAITFANLGKKTLLVDADLRKPILHKVFDVDRSPGLTHLILEDASVSEVIRNMEIPNLHMITCGEVPPNPSELLASKKMQDFLEKMRKPFDIILFDSPPVIAVTDATVLSKFVGGIVLVCKAGFTDKRILSRSIDILKQVNANTLGGVLNGVSFNSGYDSYYYYHSYYYYYGDEKRKRAVRKKRHRSVS